MVFFETILDKGRAGGEDDSSESGCPAIVQKTAGIHAGDRAPCAEMWGFFGLLLEDCASRSSTAQTPAALATPKNGRPLARTASIRSQRIANLLASFTKAQRPQSLACAFFAWRKFVCYVSGLFCQCQKL
jgi:hypothetical protein